MRRALSTGLTAWLVAVAAASGCGRLVENGTPVEPTSPDANAAIEADVGDAAVFVAEASDAQSVTMDVPVAEPFDAGAGDDRAVAPDATPEASNEVDVADGSDGPDVLHEEAAADASSDASADATDDRAAVAPSDGASDAAACCDGSPVDAAPDAPDVAVPPPVDGGACGSGCDVFNASSTTARGACTQTEQLLFRTDGTGACLACAYSAACLDDALGDFGFECEDPLTTGTRDECLAVLQCSLAVPSDRCGRSGSDFPAKGGSASAYCGSGGAAACTTPTGACAGPETAGFPGVSYPQDILSVYNQGTYAAGRANQIVQCARASCASACGF
jgi:hypothetical protein